MSRNLICVLAMMIAVSATTGAINPPGETPSNTPAPDVTSHPMPDAYSGWRLGIQLWTFHKYTFYEAVEKTSALGLTWVEAFPGQKLSEHDSDLKFDHNLPPEKRAEVKKLLASKGLRLVNYGVVELPNDETACRKVFVFAKDMGIETIMSEPKEEAWDLIERLCKEYEIKVAIHNHPKPTHYWSPDKVLEICEGRSKWIGACADIGHWMRSGVKPIEALRKLKGRIISFHFGDLNEFGVRKAHDVAWGAGVADVKAILEEMHRQQFKGVFSVEFEHNWLTSMPEIRRSIKYFNSIANRLNPSGWQNLFADGLANALMKPGTWEMGDDGELALVGGGYIWTKERYGDFVLDLEFKLSENANSGVFFRAGDLDNYVQTAIEVQIHESTDGSKHGQCGAIYDCLSPSKNRVKKAGEWNRYTIICKANKIYIVQNGEQIIDMDLNLWTEPHKNPDGTRNKFNTAYKNMPRKGHIGLQDHGDAVWFRNLKIRRLKDGTVIHQQK